MVIESPKNGRFYALAQKGVVCALVPTVPEGPGNPSIPIMLYYRIRELNFYFPGLPGRVPSEAVSVADVVRSVGTRIGNAQSKTQKPQ